MRGARFNRDGSQSVIRDGVGNQPIHLSNSHAKSAAAFGRPRGWPSRVPRRGTAGVCPRRSRGGAPIGAQKIARLGGRARPFGEGTLRPSALRAAVYGLRGRASADRAFPALALGVAIITVANGSREGRSAPGAIPVPPEGRACKARGAGAAPRSAMDASGGALE